MGWTVLYLAPSDPKAEIDGMLTWESESGKRRVLKSNMVGATYYGAVEHTKPDGERIVWAAVFLTSSRKGEWGYKDMDETMGPNKSSCPAGILNLLTPTDSQWANEWRKRCRAHIEAQRNRPKPKPGALVQSGSHKYRLEHPAGRRRGWVVTRDDGAVFRMTAQQLSRAMKAQDRQLVSAAAIQA